MRAVEIGSSRLVSSAERDYRVVETCAGVDAQSVGDVEIIKHIDAEIGVLRSDIDRRNVIIADG